MAIDNSNIIDFIGIDEESNEVILTISDHWDWEDITYHLELLQMKLNAYISFIESGEIFEAYHNAVNKIIVIQVAGKYDLPREALVFYKQANAILFELNSKVSFKKLAY